LRAKLNEEFLKLYYADHASQPLVAADANVLMDLGDEAESVIASNMNCPACYSERRLAQGFAKRWMHVTGASQIFTARAE
jgi:hypothetical protein